MGSGFFEFLKRGFFEFFQFFHRPLFCSLSTSPAGFFSFSLFLGFFFVVNLMCQEGPLVIHLELASFYMLVGEPDANVDVRIKMLVGWEDERSEPADPRFAKCWEVVPRWSWWKLGSHLRWNRRLDLLWKSWIGVAGGRCHLRRLINQALLFLVELSDFLLQTINGRREGGYGIWKALGIKENFWFKRGGCSERECFASVWGK